MRKKLIYTLLFLNLFFTNFSFAEMEQTNSLIIDGLERSYELFVPSSESKAIVIVLHGGGSNGKRMSKYTNFVELAKKENFILVFPNSFGKNWNDGRKFLDSNIDDVKFISKIIDQLNNKFDIDTKKVYVTGISNGALMCFKLAYEIPEKITAIAPVEGALSEELYKSNFKLKIPLLMMNGTKDPIVKYDGGQIDFFSQKRGKILSVEDAFNFWGDKNNCDKKFDIEQLPDIKNDGTKVFKLEKKNCDKKVILYKIENGGHTWAGTTEFNFMQEYLVGKTSYDINANEVIWDFFKSL